MDIFGSDDAVPLTALGVRGNAPDDEFVALPEIGGAFEAAAARQRRTVVPDAGRREGRATRFGERLGERVMTMPAHVIESLATLPQRALTASEQLRLGYGYDPWPALEAALLTIGARPLAPRRAPVSATHEAAPGSETGHLPGFMQMTEDERAAYAGSPRSTWANGPEGRDAIYHDVGRLVEPTTEMQGLYETPTGIVETNPGWVARPQVDTAAGSTKLLSPHDRAVIEAGEAVRGAIDAQNASAAHIALAGRPAAESNSLFAPAFAKMSREQLLALRRIGQEHGLPEVIDTGRGVTMTRFHPEPENIGPAMRESDLPAEIENTVGRAPRRVKVDGVYIDYVPEWRQGVGSGAVTRKMLSYVDRARGLRELLNASELIPRNARARMERDYDWAKRAGPVREDIQNARRIIGEGPRWIDRLEAAVKAGAILPATAAVMLATAGREE